MNHDSSQRFVIQSLTACVSILLWISCTNISDDTKRLQASSWYEAISLSGDTLLAPPLPDSVYAMRDSLIREARTAYDADSTELGNIIWYGRRLAYLHRYREAIDIYTRGLTYHPSSPELYRHRGHRYITTRQFQMAIHDFKKGIELAAGRGVEMEADGLPNKLHIPLSHLHFNLWYHLGLAHYLYGDYDEAIAVLTVCLSHSINPDLEVATKAWLYLALMRSQKMKEADALLTDVHPDMEIIENQDYHTLLLLYQGEIEMISWLNTLDLSDASPALLYGLSQWYALTDRPDQSDSIRQVLLDSNQWPAFGYIAAEADAARNLHHSVPPLPQ